MQVDRYIKRHPKLKKQLAETLSKERGVQQKIQETSCQREQLEKDRKKTAAKLKSVEQEVKKLLRNQTPHAVVGRKRKYGSDNDRNSKLSFTHTLRTTD